LNKFLFSKFSFPQHKNFKAEKTISSIEMPIIFDADHGPFKTTSRLFSSMIRFFAFLLFHCVDVDVEILKANAKYGQDSKSENKS
jgi:hypothetical protein